MKIDNFYVSSCINMARNLAGISKSKGLPLARIMNVYNKFNSSLYKESEEKAKERNTVRSNETIGRYNSSIEEKALQLTEVYFNLQKN